MSSGFDRTRLRMALERRVVVRKGEREAESGAKIPAGGGAPLDGGLRAARAARSSENKAKKQEKPEIATALEGGGRNIYRLAGSTEGVTVQ